MYPPPPYRSRSAVTLQSDHSLGPTRPPIPQSAPRFHSIPNARPTIPQSAQRFHSIPNARPPIPQSAPRFYSIQHARPHIPQSAPRFYSIQNAPASRPHQSNDLRGTVPSQQSFSTSPYVPYGTIAQTVKPQIPRKIHSFIASSPFRVFRDDDNIDVPSDGLTFDEIPTAGSATGTELSRGRDNNSHGASSNQTFGGLSNSAPPLAGRYARSSSLTQPISHSPLNNSQPLREPEVLINQMPDTVPPISNYQVDVPPVTMPMSYMGSSSAEQLTSQVFPDLLEPLRSETERPSIVGHRSSYPSQPEEPIFTRFIRFFQFGRSHRVHSPKPDSSQPSTVPVIYHESEIEWDKFALKFILVTVPGQLYLFILLRLPSLYFSRVARIFEEANMSLPEIKKMALETASQGLTHEFEIQMAFESSSVPPSFKKLTSTWEYFIDSVIREWKTFNIVSVLLLNVCYVRLSLLLLPNLILAQGHSDHFAN